MGGGWSTSFVAHVSQLHRPGQLPDEVAVLTDPFASALRPVLLHPPFPGGKDSGDGRAGAGVDEPDIVLVIGAGTIGLLTIKALRLIGWDGPIAVLGRYGFQLEMAERAGATHLFRSRDEVYAWASSLPGARMYKPTLAPRFVEGGPSLVYDTVGTAGSAGDSLALTREGGRIVLVGAAARLEADWTRLWYRQLSIAGVFAYGLAPYRGSAAFHDVSIELMQQDGFATWDCDPRIRTGGIPCRTLHGSRQSRTPLSQGRFPAWRLTIWPRTRATRSTDSSRGARSTS